MDKQNAIKYKSLMINEKEKLWDLLLPIENIFEVYHAKNMQDAICHLASFPYHLVVLVSVQDIEITCKMVKTIRGLQKDPIIILVSENIEESILCIKKGADVVLTINCKKEDLRLRIYTLLQRYLGWEMGNDNESDIIQNDLFIMNFSMRKAFWKEHELNFTKHEFDFLYLLASSSERVYTYSQIYQIVWNEYPQGNIVNMIRCMIKRIKKKLKAADSDIPDMIHNVRDIGYFFKLENTDT